MTSTRPARFINKPEITAMADRLLAEMLNANWTPQWSQLADLVADYLDLSIVGEDFEAIKGGVIAAKIYPTRGEIYINNAFPAIRDHSGLCQSTLADEIGHWLLPIDRDASESAIDVGQRLYSTIRQFPRDPIDRLPALLGAVLMTIVTLLLAIEMIQPDYPQAT